MQVRFAEHALRVLYEDPDARDRRFDRAVIRSYRKKVGFIAAATDERDLYAMRSLRLEKLKGDREGQHSIRLNDQWRLILSFERDELGRLVTVIEIVDYH